MEKGHKYGRVKYVEPILKKLPHCHYEWVHYAGTESWRPGYENHKYQSLLSKEILIAACVASLAAPLFTGCSSQTQLASGGQETVSAETTASGGQETGAAETTASPAQAVLKTVSCAIFGLALLLLYWKTRNIWACAIVHGLFDFFPSISGAIYNRLSPRLR